jgi:hypothetical protein
MQKLQIATYPAVRSSMNPVALFALSISTLALCQQPAFVLEYNCTADGIPHVVVDAGQGMSQPSVEFFLPMFDNCSMAELRIPAHFAAGECVLCLHLRTRNAG